jgi:hypothetical protein
MKIVPSKEDSYQEFVIKNSDDLYSKETVNYAERWADLMETLIDSGMILESIAKSASYEANIDGITGFMFGCAVETLSSFWIHGEQLRKWHNKEYNCPDSEGVVNPALLSIK